VTATFSHFGICVSDLQRSLRFYCEALGFEQAESHAIGDAFASLMEFDHVELTSQYIRRESLAIELLAFSSPATVGEAVRRPVNQLGLTHLSFRVDDVDSVAAGIAALGGVVHGQTRTTFELGDGKTMDFVYCTDPDGTRIELMYLPI
jgi:catechol 2,3-dioxygenase-like lactoylglutathione lyase family enzyme